MNGAVSTTGIVSYADQHLGIQVLFAWQLCSGFSHGRPWAALGLLERHELESSEEGVVLMRQTSSLDRALYPTAVAFGVLNRTFALLHDRCRP